MYYKDMLTRHERKLLSAAPDPDEEEEFMEDPDEYKALKLVLLRYGDQGTMISDADGEDREDSDIYGSGL